MYLFVAKYLNWRTREEITRKIEFDGENMFDSARECYVYAMCKAFDMTQEGECLGSLEFIECQKLYVYQEPQMSGAEKQ